MNSQYKLLPLPPPCRKELESPADWSLLPRSLVDCSHFPFCFCSSVELWIVIHHPCQPIQDNEDIRPNKNLVQYGMEVKKRSILNLLQIIYTGVLKVKQLSYIKVIRFLFPFCKKIFGLLICICQSHVFISPVNKREIWLRMWNLNHFIYLTWTVNYHQWKIF